MPSDIIRLGGGQTMTLGRAIALGIADAEGNILKPPPDSQGEKLLRQAERAAEWSRRQQAEQMGTVEPEGIEDSSAYAQKRADIEPLKPRNVDADGEPIEDPVVLDAIAERTALIEDGEPAPTLAEVIQAHEEATIAGIDEPEAISVDGVAETPEDPTPTETEPEAPAETPKRARSAKVEVDG